VLIDNESGATTEKRKMDIAKCPQCPLIVIPAKAEIQSFQAIMDSHSLIGSRTGFAGLTRFLTFYETISFERRKK